MFTKEKEPWELASEKITEAMIAIENLTIEDKQGLVNDLLVVKMRLCNADKEPQVKLLRVLKN